tara:strand:+ start:717 stop:830 length:114 start_codon:yes stop_codon:yes gene_type:complete
VEVLSQQAHHEAFPAMQSKRTEAKAGAAAKRAEDAKK